MLTSAWRPVEICNHFILIWIVRKTGHLAKYTGCGMFGMMDPENVGFMHLQAMLQ